MLLWIRRAAAAVTLLFAAALPARAQDSAFVVSKAGANLFRVNQDGGAVFNGTFDNFDPFMQGAGIPAEGPGARMMWFPRKAAFRAGYVDGTQWDAASTGYMSVALGYNTSAPGDYAFAAGWDNIASGASSVALGYHASTNSRQGSFVFGDRSVLDTIRAGVNGSATWRVSGGFRIFTAGNLTTGVTIQSGLSTSNWGQQNAVISTSTGAYLSTSGVWTNSSDVNRKHLFAHVDGEDVLLRLRRLPLRTWSYRVDPDSVRHLGPTAQDFSAAFGLGSDNRVIGTVDADGVALAAAKALETRTTAQAARIQALERENAELRARLERIEAALAAQKP